MNKSCKHIDIEIKVFVENNYVIFSGLGKLIKKINTKLKDR